MDRFWENGLIPYAIFPFPVMELQSQSSISRAKQKVGRARRVRVALFRLIDRGRALASGARLGPKDRAFRAALLRTRL